MPDPLDPRAWNRFGYVYGNPANFVDPSGHNPALIGIGIGALIGGGIGAGYAYQQGYGVSTPEFWLYAATGAVLGGATGGLLGVGAGIAGTAARTAWAAAYANSPLFSWWAGGGLNIIRSWGTRSLMGRIGGGFGLFGRGLATPFALSQISAEFINAFPGALGRATVGAFVSNAFLKDAVISFGVYGISTGVVDLLEGRQFGASLNVRDASTAILLGGIGGMANAAIPTSWSILARGLSYYSIYSLAAGAAYVTANYTSSRPIVGETLGEAMFLGGIISPINFIGPARYYYPILTGAGIGTGLAAWRTPW